MPNHNHSSAEDDSYSADSINFGGIMNTLLERAWLIALCIGAAVFLAAVYLRHAEKVYQARVVLQIEQEQPRILNIQNVHVEDYERPEALKTIEQTLKNRELMERVVDALNLSQDPRFVSVEEGEPVPTRSQLASEISGMVDVQLRNGTRLIDINVEHTDPELAADVANAVLEQFMRQNLEQQSSSARFATEWLQEQAARLAEQLQISENALYEFKERNKFVPPSQSHENAAVDQLRSRLTEAKASRIQLEADYQQIATGKEDPLSLLTVPFVANNPAVVQLQDQLVTQESEVRRVNQRYKWKHIKYIEAHQKLDSIKTALTNAVLQAAETVATALANARTAEKALEQSLVAEEAGAIAFSKLTTEYDRLLRQVENDRALYQNVLARMKETGITQDLEVSKIRLVQRAEVPNSPIRPNKQQVIIIALAAGLILGVALALLLGAMDNSLKSLDEAEEYLRMPVLTTIPQVRRALLDSTQLVMARNSSLSGAESFRSLRTSLALLGGKEQQKVYLFTSAVPEEGKTFCSLNYAYSLAQQGHRVILIDCDLRRPTVEQCLCSTQSQLPGLSDYLNAQAGLEKTVHETGIPNFRFMPAGTPVANPSELLGLDRFEALLSEVLNDYDRVVLDSAPIFGVSDTLLMIGRAHVACLVVRAYKTPRKKVLRAVQILRNAEAPLAGVVLNRVPPNDRRNDNDPYYDYGYANERSENIVRLERVS